MTLSFYDSWRTVSSTPSEYWQESMQALIDDQFENAPNVLTIKWNGTDSVVRVTSKVLETNLSRDKDKYRQVIFKDVDIIPTVGDIGIFQGYTWICTQTDNLSIGQKSCTVEQCNNVLKFYDQNSILYEIPCIVGKGSLGLETNKFMSLASDENIVQCSNTVNSLKIDLNTRFILSGDAYSVLGIGKIEVLGLLLIRIKDDLINTVDDRVDLGIANWNSNQHSYNVLILNGSIALFRQNETLQLNTEVLDNSSVIIPTPTVTYLSSNVNICTVSTTGFITGIAVGVCTITVSYGAVSSIITITVTSVVYDNITVSITGNTTVKLNNIITLTSHILNNGIEDVTKTVLWSISNQDLSSNIYFSVTSQTGNSIVLKATSNSSYVNKFVTIRATKSDDFSKFFDFNVQVKSLL